MAIRTIRLIGDAVLRQSARPVTEFNASLCRLLDDMAETMYQAEGIGLAANQIGILRRVIVSDVGNGLVELVNPEWVIQEGEAIASEGCLSLPNKRLLVKRFERVVIKGQDRSGKPVQMEAAYLFARCLQHEVDHLDGVLFIDRRVADTLPEERGTAYGTAAY